MAASRPEFLSLDQRLPLDGLSWSGEGLQAAVLVALTDENPPRVILGRRAGHLRLHPGEIAFPGGKREPEDHNPWATARREAREEIGLAPQLVHPLGELAPLVTRSRFEVHPCIARIPAGIALQVDRSEFDSVFNVPLRTFADPALFRLEEMHDGERSRMVPHYDMGDDNIWGVTAAILAQLVNVAYDAGLDLRRDWKVEP